MTVRTGPWGGPGYACSSDIFRLTCPGAAGTDSPSSSVLSDPTTTRCSSCAVRSGCLRIGWRRVLRSLDTLELAALPLRLGGSDETGSTDRSRRL